MAKPLTTDEIKSRCEKVGLTYVDKYVKNKRTFIVARCECGEIVNVDMGSIGQYMKKNNIYSCKECAIKKRKVISLSADEIENRCEKVGLEYINHYYIKEKGATYVLVKCNCGNIFEVVLDSITRAFKKGIKHRCEDCMYEYIKGESNPMYGVHRYGKSNPNYNPNLTDEERELGRNIPGYDEWVKQVKEQANFTCDCCGQRGGKLRSHHLDGYSSCKERRRDLTNGVCLCEHCHKDFHKHYGKNNNTEEQYLEYKFAYENN